MMRYERALAIANQLQNLFELVRSGAFSSNDLANKFEVSEQTTYRDIDFLKERGYSIRSVRPTKGWEYKLLFEASSIPNE